MGTASIFALAASVVVADGSSSTEPSKIAGAVAASSSSTRRCRSVRRFVRSGAHALLPRCPTARCVLERLASLRCAGWATAVETDAADCARSPKTTREGSSFAFSSFVSLPRERDASVCTRSEETCVGGPSLVSLVTGVLLIFVISLSLILHRVEFGACVENVTALGHSSLALPAVFSLTAGCLLWRAHCSGVPERPAAWLPKEQRSRAKTRLPPVSLSQQQTGPRGSVISVEGVNADHRTTFTF